MLGASLQCGHDRRSQEPDTRAESLGQLRQECCELVRLHPRRQFATTTIVPGMARSRRDRNASRSTSPPRNSSARTISASAEASVSWARALVRSATIPGSPRTPASRAATLRVSASASVSASRTVSAASTRPPTSASSPGVREGFADWPAWPAAGKRSKATITADR